MKTIRIACSAFSLWMFLAIALVVTTQMARASISPATWVSGRIVGVAEGVWISIDVERYISSAYKYRTKTAVRVIDTLSGCMGKRALLRDAEYVDENASENWLITLNPAIDPVLAVEIISGMTPVIPSPWRESLLMENGSIFMIYDEKKLLLVGADSVRKWAALQNIQSQEFANITAVFESSDTLQGSKFVFVELESAYRDIDADYARFVVPLEIEDLSNLLSSGISDPDKLAATQPQPNGC